MRGSIAEASVNTMVVGIGMLGPSDAFGVARN